jgi:hypothetical protein
VTQAEALGLTLLFEVPLALLLAARWRPPWGRLLLVACATSLLTHPFAWNGIRHLDSLPFWARAALFESAVALVEGVMYARLVPLGWKRGLLVGAVVNAFSFGLGLVLSRAGWI